MRITQIELVRELIRDMTASVVGVSFLFLFTGIIAWGFSNEVREQDLYLAARVFIGSSLIAVALWIRWKILVAKIINIIIHII